MPPHIDHMLYPLFPCYLGAAHLLPSEDLHTYNCNLSKAFISRGYPIPLIQKQLSRALYHSNTTLRPSCDTNHFSLTTTYYWGLHQLKWIFREGFHILSLDPSTQDLLTKPPSVNFHKPPNLCQLIVDTSLHTPNPVTPTGSRPCNRPQCKTCRIHPPASSFISSYTNLMYPITTHADCKSMNLI